MSSLPAPDSLVAELRVIARHAGAAILEHYRAFDAADASDAAALSSKIGLRQKPDATPVTAADDDAERIILDALARLAPEVPVVSEEATARAGALPSISSDRFFLVDPLDGTREFLTKNGEFTVNIALIERGIPVAGVVCAPALSRSWFGGLGAGAFQSGGDGTPAEMHARRPPAAGAVVVASRRHGDVQALDEFLAHRTVEKLVQTGSSLKFCLVAAGEADIYPRFGRTMEWDTAAGHAVLLAAGGSVLTVDGDPLHYGKAGFENPHFIAWGLA
jgi:3'(2'), 5'-bisphosphate nucleotidase